MGLDESLLSRKLSSHPFAFGPWMVWVQKGIHLDPGLVPNFVRAALVRVFVEHEEQMHDITPGPHLFWHRPKRVSTHSLSLSWSS